MLKLIKTLYHDLSITNSRNYYICCLLGNIPGDFGIAVRQKWFQKKFQSAGINLRVHYRATFIHPDRISCGNDVEIGQGCYFQGAGGITIGDNAMIAPFVKIWSVNHNYKNPDQNIREQGYETKAVQIGNDVWIGADSFIMPGAKIGDKCVIGACSVLGAKNYPAGSILMGNPARKIGIRR